MKDYLARIGLTNLIDALEGVELNHVVEEALAESRGPFMEFEAKDLCEYLVPIPPPGGDCTSVCEIKEDIYDLSVIYGLSGEERASSPHVLRLWKLRGVVERMKQLVGADWVGIYRRMINKNGDEVLVKEAYYGVMSRAEFPLTDEFADKSNNSTVGMRGIGVLVQNVEEYEGPYYQCDSNVQSECCVPILNSSGEVTGIIDAESFQPNFFTPDRALQVIKVCRDLGIMDELFSKAAVAHLTAAQ